MVLKIITCLKKGFILEELLDAVTSKKLNIFQQYAGNTHTILLFLVKIILLVKAALVFLQVKK